MALPRQISELLFPVSGAELKWHMHDSEKMALLHILRLSRPAISLEIGTMNGGSLRQIAAHSQMTYSIDIDPSVREKLQPLMPDVRFLTGDSPRVVGEVLADLLGNG